MTTKEGDRRITLVYVGMVLIFFATLVGFSYVLSQTSDLSSRSNVLGIENRHRINDIQRSRLESCKTTYLGIKKVFKPFFPKHPTPQQKKDLKKFDSTISHLQKRCRIQTLPREKKKSVTTSTEG